MASLTQKQDCKNWMACFTLPDGTRTQRSTGTIDRKLAQKIADSYEEAAQKAKVNQFVEKDARGTLNEILRRVGEDTINSDTVEHFLRQWLEGKENTGTRERYTHAVELFLKYLGTKASALLSKISHKDVQGFIKGRQAANLASKTISIDAKILSAAFNKARKQELTDHNPFERALAINPIKVRSSTRKEFSPEQVAKIVQAASGEWKTVICFGYFTGARLEDCARMQWSNVDFSEGVIKYIARKRNKEVVIPMTEQLEEHLQRIASTDSTNPFITPILAEKGSGGKSGLSEAFKKIMAKAGIDTQTIQGKGQRKFSQLSFHSLRHTTNTLLANNGIDQETRMKLIGHSSKQINSGYTHLDLPKLKGAMEKLPNLPL